MSLGYAYNPYLWPALISAAIIAFLGFYSWRRRYIHGALPFGVAAILSVLWIIGLMMESAAIEPSTKIFWFSFQGVWQVPAATAMTCFMLQYAGLNRWLTRRNLLLLSIPPLIVLILILTNSLHHLFWQGFQVDIMVRPIRGTAYWIGFGYAFALALLNLIVLIWLFVRSPQHRWPVILMLIGQVGARIFYSLDAMNKNFLEPLSPIFFMFVLMFSVYALALFRFHVFNPVPLARATVLEQISEGMLVLDLEGRIADLNSAAGKMLGRPPASLRGRPAVEMLPTISGILAQLDKTSVVQSEISLGTDNSARDYELNLTPLMDRRGEVLGRLLLLHDITEQKRAQAQVLEQQRVVAALEERERLARELHDGIGQVIGYIGIQAQTARKWVQDGNTLKADSILGRLIEVAKDAHSDVRESILSLRGGTTPELPFIPALKQYLERFQANYNIRTELSLHGTIGGNTFSSDAGVQLLRVIQEALTNARKHSGARSVRVNVEQGEGWSGITIVDDGIGFDLKQLDLKADRHFGLAFMNERMAQIGGLMKIESHPKGGTIVKLEVPVRN